MVAGLETKLARGASEVWLGVRDDFRTWFLQNAVNSLIFVGGMGEKFGESVSSAA